MMQLQNILSVIILWLSVLWIKSYLYQPLKDARLVVTPEVDLAVVGIFAPDIDLCSPSSLHHYDRPRGGARSPPWYYVIRALAK